MLASPPIPSTWIIASHESLPSTQTRMRERIESGEDVHGHVVRAGRQTAGSGTRGRSWASDPGGSWQTLAVRTGPPTSRAAPAPDGDPADGHSVAPDAGTAPAPRRSLRSAGVSIAIGIGLAQAFASHGALVKVKWPNDLIYRDRKLGGILCESWRGWLLIGVGINVANEPPAGGVALTGWDLEVVHERVLRGVTEGLTMWIAGAPLAAAFAPFDHLTGRPIEVRTGDRHVAGTAMGITDDGALRVGRDVIRDGTIVNVAAQPSGGCSSDASG